MNIILEIQKELNDAFIEIRKKLYEHYGIQDERQTRKKRKKKKK